MFVAVAVVMAVIGEYRLGRWRSCADLWSSLAPGLPEIIPGVLAWSAAASEPRCR